MDYRLITGIGKNINLGMMRYSRATFSTLFGSDSKLTISNKNDSKSNIKISVTGVSIENLKKTILFDFPGSEYEIRNQLTGEHRTTSNRDDISPNEDVVGMRCRL